MLSAEINLSIKIKIEINISIREKPLIGEIFWQGNSNQRKVTKFHKQIGHFSTNITLTVKSTETAGKQTGKF